MRALLWSLANTYRHWLTTPVLDFSSQVYGRLWDTHWYIQDRRGDGHRFLQWLRDNIWWIPFVGDITGWIDIAIDLLADAALTGPDRGIAWFNGNVNPDTGEFWWLTHVRAAAQSLLDTADAVGQRLDLWGADPWGFVRAIVESPMHHIGWAVGFVAQVMAELPDNPFGPIIARYPNWWDRLHVVFGELGRATQDRLTRMADRVWSTVDGPLNAVGNTLGALESIIRGEPPNRWPEIRGSGAFPFAAIETMGHLVAFAALARISAGVQQAIDRARDQVAGAILPLTDWITQADAPVWWVRTHMQFLTSFSANPQNLLWGLWWTTLWPTVERWLADVWDGNA